MTQSLPTSMTTFWRRLAVTRSSGGTAAVAREIFRHLITLPTWSWRAARAHNLNPWVFIAMSILGWVVHSLVYLPCCQGSEWQLALLIALRVMALVVPCYILLKGRGLARAFSTSMVVMFALNTSWHVCYYVYL